METEIRNKQAALEKILGGFDSLLVAFSGGVDSTLLVAMAGKVLGSRVMAVTFAAPFHSRRETLAAIRLAEDLGVRHRLLESDAILPPELAENRRERCYHCKKFLGEQLGNVAAELKVGAIAHGANLDDLKDYRPGFRAAVETGMTAPLLDAGFTKSDIRKLAREIGLSVWNKPALACLATRIPYGTLLTPDRLKKIEQAESTILGMGFSTCRVRLEGNTARIELDPAEISRMLEAPCRDNIVSGIRAVGFAHVSLDLEGYIQGKMNRAL
jgi:uncharacterized protein